MSTNNKILIAGISAAGIILLGCLIIAHMFNLRHPVFLEHYIENPIVADKKNNMHYDDMSITIQYITNVIDGRQINYIEFEENKDVKLTAESTIDFFLKKNKNYIEETYGRYSIRTISLKMQYINFDKMSDDIELEKAIIHYNNGDIQKTDIGKIVLYRYNSVKSDVRFKKVIDGEDFQTVSTYMIDNDIVLQSIQSPVMDILKSDFNIKVNDADWQEIEGMKYEAGFPLKVKTSVHQSKIDQYRFKNIVIYPRLYYRDIEGNLNYEKIELMNQPFTYKFTFSGIVKYLKTRGESKMPS